MPPFQKKVVEPTESVETPSENPSITLTLADLKELLGGHSQGITADVLSEIMTKTAALSAEAMRKSLKPENTNHPNVSAFSYPQGDRDKPKATLPFELLWRGFPVHKESSVVTWWEMEEYAKLQPGTYTCSKQDMSPIRVTVTASYGPDNQTIERLTVMYDGDRDLRVTTPSPFVWAYQMNHADRPARETFVEAMTHLLTIQMQDRKAKDALLVAS